MSVLHSARVLRPNAPQLPVSWYFEPKVFDLEKKLLFGRGPGYVGHALMVPSKGDYQTLGWKDAGQVPRHRAAFERVPSSAGSAPRGTRQCAEHRLPAPPLDV
jgi:hypothetical protein